MNHRKWNVTRSRKCKHPGCLPEHCLNHFNKVTNKLCWNISVAPRIYGTQHSTDPIDHVNGVKEKSGAGGSHFKKSSAPIRRSILTFKNALYYDASTR